jgi:glycosyltransferase involved in cell wall biosynthesis
MRVFIDGIVFGRQIVGGISRTWEELLRRFPRHGIETDLLIPFRRKNYSLQRILEDEDNFHVHNDFFYWPSRYFERVGVRDGVIRTFYLKREDEIFHSTYFSTVYAKGVRKVVTINDMIPEVFQDHYRTRWTQFGIDAKRKVLENADAIVAISANTKKDLLRIYPWIPDRKITVIHLAVSTVFWTIESADTLSRYGLEKLRGGYFLFVGSGEGYKNFRILVELVKSFPRFRDATFVCVGSRPSPSLQNMLASLGVKDRFMFLEGISDGELGTLYANALGFIYPSQYEGFGLPVLEAMANNCPVVCSGTSSFPEVAGDAAFYFDPDSVASLSSAIEEAMKCDRKVYVQRAQTNLKRFSWDRSTSELIKLYSSIA